jgi:hypothetical protein
MLGYQGISEQSVRIEVFEGKPNLPTYLATLRLRPRFVDLQALAIVRDADEDAGGAFASVTGHLASNGLIVPQAHGDLVRGPCDDGVERSVGVFIAPDGVARGALESLYLRAIGPGPLVDCVQQFMRCIAPAVEHTLVAQWAKVEFHAWLATCPAPGIQPGQAMDANYFDRDSPAFDAIKQFIRDLARAASEADTSGA